MALSFHRVHKAITAKIAGFYHINSNCNPADILSKHWSYAMVWPYMQPLLFWQGDTANIDKTKYRKSKEIHVPIAEIVKEEISANA